jgi:hypothetical protein
MKIHAKIATVFIILAASLQGCSELGNKGNSQSNSSLTGPLAKSSHTVEDIHWNGIEIGPLKLLQSHGQAYMPLAKATASLIVSPGAKVPISTMSGFASKLADKGVAVYVVEYVQDTAIIPTEWNRTLHLAQALNESPEKVAGLSPEMVASHKSKLSISILGHSLGGAVLGVFLDKKEAEFIKSFFLFGVSSVIGEPNPSNRNVHLLTGTEDGLVSPTERLKMETLFDVKTEFVQGVNHFCIIDSERVGNPKKRAEDKVTLLSKSQCQENLIQTLSAQGLF